MPWLEQLAISGLAAFVVCLGWYVLRDRNVRSPAAPRPSIAKSFETFALFVGSLYLINLAASAIGVRPMQTLEIIGGALVITLFDQFRQFVRFQDTRAARTEG